jgi:hypothetical protein
MPRPPMPYPENPAMLRHDAQVNGFLPGALVRLIHLNADQPVLVTSWPYFEGTGDDQAVWIMARTDPTDPTSNAKMRYFLLVTKIGEVPASEW